MSGVRFLELDGVTVILDASEASGYRLVRADMPERLHRRSTAASDDVEGDVEQSSVLDAGVYELGFLVGGVSGTQIETRRVALRNACEHRVYLLEVTWDGVIATWKARRADSSAVTDGNWRLAGQRPVNLRVPVQPRTLEELG